MKWVHSSIIKQDSAWLKNVHLVTSFHTEESYTATGTPTQHKYSDICLHFADWAAQNLSHLSESPAVTGIESSSSQHRTLISCYLKLQKVTVTLSYTNHRKLDSLRLKSAACLLENLSQYLHSEIWPHFRQTSERIRYILQYMKLNSSFLSNQCCY